jgi:hypothetical protein
MPVRYFFLMTMALCLAGCATPQPELIAYSGPHRADDNVAMLKAKTPMAIMAIDGNNGENVYPASRRNKDTTVYLEPGQHRLTLLFIAGNERGHSPANLDVYLWAGHRYIVVASTKWNWLRGSGSWSPELKDVTDQPQEWPQAK